MIAEGQFEEASAFKAEFLPAIQKVNAEVKDLRAKISAYHNTSAAKSFLKQDLAKYEKCLPEINADDFEALIDSDIATCKENMEAAKQKVELVS